MAKEKDEITRDTDLSRKKPIEKRLLELIKEIEMGFTDMNSRTNDIVDYWDCYNCVLGERQYYNGNSKIFVPIVKDAIKARKTRFLNQIFPQSGRNVEVTTSDGELPHATMSLVEDYIRQARLRTQVVPSLMVNGDVEGTYNVYCDWREIERHVARKVARPMESDGMEFKDLGEVEDIEEETMMNAFTAVEVLSDADVLVLPTSAMSVEEALEDGGSVTIMRRWSKAKIKRMMDDKAITEEAGETLLSSLSTKRQDPDKRDMAKEKASAIGIKGAPGSKFAQVAEVWTKLKVGDDMRLCRAYYGGPTQILGCKLNPFWCDLCPLISAPVDKQSGVFKGRAPLADVIDIQVAANDAMNEGEDTAHFSAMPIIMTAPDKTPNIGTMVLGLASIWQVDPNSTKFAEFPQLWKDQIARVAAAREQIFQTLGVNPAMVPNSTGRPGAKRNQAEIANEQQVDLLTTADTVTHLEEAILTPILERMVWYDMQFRDQSVLIKQYGEMGNRAKMEEVPPQQMGHRWSYRWYGVEAARNAAQIQQQIAFTNVLKGIPPQMYEGYKLNLVPVITQACENVFGPRLAPLIFIDMKKQLSMDPEGENGMLEGGFDVMVHPMDDDVKHIQSHMQAMQLSGGDIHGTFRAHIMRHQQQMQAKAAAQLQQQMAQQQPGLPGYPGGAGPGVAGSPQPGAQPAGPRLLKQAPGAIAPERLPAAGAITMPRRM